MHVDIPMTMTTMYQILTLLGMPSFIVAVVSWLYGRIKKNDDETNAVKLGVQALLRAQMIQDYNHYNEQGYAPIYARENFENCWKHYHEMGANGVLDDIRRKFMALPTTPQK